MTCMPTPHSTRNFIFSGWLWLSPLINKYIQTILTRTWCDGSLLNTAKLYVITSISNAYIKAFTLHRYMDENKCSLNSYNWYQQSTNFEIFVYEQVYTEICTGYTKVVAIKFAQYSCIIRSWPIMWWYCCLPVYICTHELFCHNASFYLVEVHV